ncbi:hypothetical protein H4219_000292 [Mycoemilia scoparia]|uniref:GTP-binding protein n=1 Tax=Mycoemilia scoparia TaxID=417184 RepID=A0A9W8A684_9FUNG|nr:hypothetical protein H4219_000292 [Mycoemilia scoparia]
MQKKILLMGKSGAGKTSMRTMIFSSFAAADTRHLGATMDVEHSTVSYISDLQLNIWDCGGQTKFMESYNHERRDYVFPDVEVLIYVFDVENYNKPGEIDMYQECIDNLSEFSPNAKVFCLIHKVDLLTEEEKAYVFKDYQYQLRVRSRGFNPEFYPTTIWSFSLYFAWSNIVYRLIPNISSIEKYLQRFQTICDAYEVVLFERTTFLVVTNIGNENDIDQQRDMQSSFDSLEIRNKQFTMFLQPFTKSTYILVVTTKPEVEPALTKYNIDAARDVFARYAEGGLLHRGPPE